MPTACGGMGSPLSDAELTMATERVWIEMPAIGTGTTDDPVRPKYPVQGKAFLIHQRGKVYVVLGDERARNEALQHADCRLLTPGEGSLFEETLPFPLPPQLFPHDDHNNQRRPVGVGDLVARLTRRVGIAECSACQQRKRRLNNIIVWGWWRR